MRVFWVGDLSLGWSSHLGMRTQLALWSSGPHPRIRLLFYGLAYTDEARGISKLESPGLKLRVSAKGLGPSL